MKSVQHMGCGVTSPLPSCQGAAGATWPLQRSRGAAKWPTRHRDPKSSLFCFAQPKGRANGMGEVFLGGWRVANEVVGALGT